MGFKERWLLEDERCPNCNQITKRVRGLTKQNLKRLMTPKFDFTEILVMFMIIMVLVLAYAYNNETKLCRETVTDMFSGNITDCFAVCDYKCQMIQGIYTKSGWEAPHLNYTLMNETNSSFQ